MRSELEQSTALTEEGRGVDMAYLRQWVGKSEQRVERLAAFPADALAATLDRDDPPFTDGTALPPLWHWLYFLPASGSAGLGADGHPERGGFLPPVPLPRRMWAGGRVHFHQPLRIGATVRRESRVVSVEHKAGRSGELVFVRVAHAITDAQGVLLLSEEQDIVYRDAPAPGAAPEKAPSITPPVDAQWERSIMPDPVLLFRYSALTFNSHRIHYDRDYASGVEGYPGLVVHGPLSATLLIDQLRRSLPAARISAFSFRALKPLFDSAPFALCGATDGGGTSAHLWTSDTNGALTMQAQVRLT